MKRLFLLCSPEQLKEPAKHADGAGELLSAYQSLWHPLLLADAEALPQTRDLADVPANEETLLAVRRAEYDAAPELLRRDLRDFGERLLLVGPEHAAVSGPDQVLATFDFGSLDPDLVHDFYALGYAFLGLKLLFDAMGHENPLDEQEFWSAVQESASAARSEDMEAARNKLRAAFEILQSARQMVYPATIFIVDLGLCFPGVGGPHFRRRLQGDAPLNLVMTGRELETLGTDEELLGALRDAIEARRLDIVGGVFDDRPLALLPHESRLWSLRRAAELYNKHLVHEVACFGARTATLMPELPQLLMKFHHRYALHAAYDGSTYPHFKNPKLHWTAADGSVIEALARTARDASSATGAWTLFEEIGRTTMNDRAATVVLAHWVHASAPWYEWLLRVNAQAPLFGTFHRFSDYFTNSTMADHPTNTRVDEYHTQALASAVAKGEEDPLGRWVRHYELRGRLDSAMALASLATVAEAVGVEEAAAESARLETEVEANAAGALEHVEHFERVMFDKLSAISLSGAIPSDGILVYNTCNFPRRLCLEIPDLPHGLAIDAPLRAAQGGPKGGVVLDMPGWGFAWFPLTPGASATEVKKTAVSAVGRKIRNEFLEVEIDAKTGGIRGIWNVRDRYGRIGQQLAHARGSKCVGTNVEVTASGPAFAEIVSTGEIRDPGGKTVLARFEQRVRLWASRPQVELHIHLDPVATPSGNNLEDAFVCRWAWADEKTLVLPASGFYLQTSHAADIEATHLIELRERNLVTDILTHGLPFHRRGSYRMLDSYLVVPGESRRDFHFSIAFDLAHPWHAVYDALSPPIWRRVAAGPPLPGRTGWLAKLSAANVVATSMTPFNDDTYPAGLRLRFAETEGKMTRSELKFCKVPIASRLTNCRDQLIFDLHVTEEGVPVDFSQFEILQVEALFQ